MRLSGKCSIYPPPPDKQTFSLEKVAETSEGEEIGAYLQTLGLHGVAVYVAEAGTWAEAQAPLKEGWTSWYCLEWARERHSDHSPDTEQQARKGGTSYRHSLSVFN